MGLEGTEGLKDNPSVPSSVEKKRRKSPIQSSGGPLGQDVRAMDSIWGQMKNSHQPTKAFSSDPKSSNPQVFGATEV